MKTRTLLPLALAFGCGGESGGTGGGDSGGPAPDGGGQPDGGGGAPNFDELIEAGVTQYFGAASPSKETTDADGVTTYEFDPADGPMCLRGTPFRMATRDMGSDNLFIYLQGGGACWSTLCMATESAGSGIPGEMILDPDEELNPVRDWNVVYLPYCDGSVHSGDAEYPEEDPPRYHHGLRNVSAALDVATSLFPNPARVFLAGSSAGGYGTILGAVLVRLLYPDADLAVWNDAGVGLGRPGEQEWIEGILEEWNVLRFLPDSCEDCTARGHFTPFIAWGMERDTQVRTGVFSSYQDVVIADTFLQIGGAAFEEALVDETGRIHDAYPDRYERFFIDGIQHTTAFGLLTSVGTTSVSEWLQWMLDGDDRWQDEME